MAIVVQLKEIMHKVVTADFSKLKKPSDIAVVYTYQNPLLLKFFWCHGGMKIKHTKYFYQHINMEDRTFLVHLC